MSEFSRREMLSAQVHATYEQGFPIDQLAYETIRQSSIDDVAAPATVEPIDQVRPSRKAG